MVSIQGFRDPWQAGRNTSGATISFAPGGNNGDSVLKRALSRVKPDEGGDAHFRFGKASRFTAVTPEQQTNPGATISWPNDNNQDNEPKEIHIAEYDWVSRCWETLKVEQEGEPDNWVMVKSYTRMVFQGRDDGRLIALNLPTIADK